MPNDVAIVDVAPAAAGRLAATRPAGPRPWPDLAPSATEPVGARVYSKARFVWIRPEPSEAVEWIGYLSLGESLPLRGQSAEAADAGPGPGDGCARWYAVAPRGYVCVGKTATLDGDDPDVKVLAAGVAQHEPFPYFYGESLGTAVYIDIPPRRRQYFREHAYEAHMAAVTRARAAGTPEERAAVAPELAGVDLDRSQNAPPPRLLHLGAQAWPQTAPGKYGFPEIVGGSTIAYFTRFEADERTWVMTWDRGIVPADRLRDFPRSRFEGVALGGEVALPLAFFRRDTQKLRRAGDAVAPTGAHWPRYARVALTGESLEIDGERYLVTREDGLLCRASEVSAPHRRADPPKRLRGDTWIDISISEGWLVAYEGREPVYATMISPGRGGLPQAGKTLLETASTPAGDFTITGKFHTATMTSNHSDKVVHAEVPYTQNFSGPYALHAAYWHDDWGVGKSGGCVNLAPIDAMRLFQWTEPRLPRGWHGMRAAQGDAAAYAHATVVSLHR